MEGLGTGSAGTGTGASNGAAASNSSTGTGNQNMNTGAGNNAQTGSSAGQQNNSVDGSNLERLIQSAVDRATNRLGNENKELRNQIQQLQTQNMSDAEKYELNMTEREKALKEGEAALKTEKNKMYAMGAIKKAGLDDGTDTALSLIDLVMADDEKGIDARVESLSTLVKKLVTAEVNKTFTENGRQPGKSNNPDEGKLDKNTAAINAGKRAAAANKVSQGILDYYTGGKK